MGKRERIVRMLLLTVTAACLWACSAADDSGPENQKERAGRESSADLGAVCRGKGEHMERYMECQDHGRCFRSGQSYGIYRNTGAQTDVYGGGAEI